MTAAQITRDKPAALTRSRQRASTAGIDDAGRGPRDAPEHRVFRVSLALKGINGAIEIVVGLILLTMSSNSITALTRTLTANSFTQGATYLGIYLLAHGIPKVAVVIAVLRDELWAYPSLIAVVGMFTIYQLYLLYSGFT